MQHSFQSHIVSNYTQSDTVISQSDPITIRKSRQFFQVWNSKKFSPILQTLQKSNNFQKFRHSSHFFEIFLKRFGYFVFHTVFKKVPSGIDSSCWVYCIWKPSRVSSKTSKLSTTVCNDSRAWRESLREDVSVIAFISKL
jgi:hypothetical protein